MSIAEMKMNVVATYQEVKPIVKTTVLQAVDATKEVTRVVKNTSALAALATAEGSCVTSNWVADVARKGANKTESLALSFAQRILARSK